MAALRSDRSGLFSFFGAKPAKPSARGNATAFKVGARACKASKGPTPELRRLMRLSLEHDLTIGK